MIGIIPATVDGFISRSAKIRRKDERGRPRYGWIQFGRKQVTVEIGAKNAGRACGIVKLDDEGVGSDPERIAPEIGLERVQGWKIRRARVERHRVVTSIHAQLAGDIHIPGRVHGYAVSDFVKRAAQ